MAEPGSRCRSRLGRACSETKTRAAASGLGLKAGTTNTAHALHSPQISRKVGGAAPPRPRRRPAPRRLRTGSQHCFRWRPHFVGAACGVAPLLSQLWVRNAGLLTLRDAAGVGVPLWCIYSLLVSTRTLIHFRNGYIFRNADRCLNLWKQ